MGQTGRDVLLVEKTFSLNFCDTCSAKFFKFLCFVAMFAGTTSLSLCVCVCDAHHVLNLGHSPAWKLTHEVQIFYVVGLNFKDLSKRI